MLGNAKESELPPGCALMDIRRIFTGFLRAVNTQQQESVRNYIAPQPELNWFGVGQPRKGYLRLEDPRHIARYFTIRANSGQKRLTLRNAEVSPLRPSGVRSGPYKRPANGPGADDPVVAVGFTLEVDAKGMARQNQRSSSRGGKAGINCATGQFYIWNGG